MALRFCHILSGVKQRPFRVDRDVAQDRCIDRSWKLASQADTDAGSDDQHVADVQPLRAFSDGVPVLPQHRRTVNHPYQGLRRCRLARKECVNLCLICKARSCMTRPSTSNKPGKALCQHFVDRNHRTNAGMRIIIPEMRDSSHSQLGVCFCIIRHHARRPACYKSVSLKNYTAAEPVLSEAWLCANSLLRCWAFVWPEPGPLQRTICPLTSSLAATWPGPASTSFTATTATKPVSITHSLVGCTLTVG